VNIGLLSLTQSVGVLFGTNIDTTPNAVLVSIAGNTNAKRAALVHVMFNVIGVVWALPLLFPLLNLVNMILPPRSRKTSTKPIGNCKR